MDWYIDISKKPNNLCQNIVEKFVDIHKIHYIKTNNRLLVAQEKLYRIACHNMELILEKIMRKYKELQLTIWVHYMNSKNMRYLYGIIEVML